MEPNDSQPIPGRARWVFAVAVTLFIALAAGALSYDHALAVSTAVGTRPPLAYLVPLLPDGLIVLSTVAMYHAAQIGVRRPAWAMAGLVVGVGVTLVMNVAAGWPEGIGGRAVYALPPVVLVIALEILIWIFRTARAVGAAVANDGANGQSEPLEPLSMDEALAQLLETGSRRGLADALGVPKSRVDTWAARTAKVADPVAPDGDEAEWSEAAWDPRAAAALNGSATHG